MEWNGIAWINSSVKKYLNYHLVQLLRRIGVTYIYLISIMITGIMSVFRDQLFKPNQVTSQNEFWFESLQFKNGCKTNQYGTTKELLENEVKSVFGLWVNVVRVPGMWCLLCSSGRWHYFLPISWCFKDHQYYIAVFTSRQSAAFSRLEFPIYMMLKQTHIHQFLPRRLRWTELAKRKSLSSVPTPSFVTSHSLSFILLLSLLPGTHNLTQAFS